MAGRKPKDGSAGDRYPSAAAGEMLAEARQRAGLTRQMLAALTGVNEYTVKMYEQGVVRNPTVEIFNALHKELKPVGLAGWVLLEAYGYNTDASQDNVMPALVHVLRSLDENGQRHVLGVAQHELKRNLS